MRTCLGPDEILIQGRRRERKYKVCVWVRGERAKERKREREREGGREREGEKRERKGAAHGGLRTASGKRGGGRGE